LFISDGTSVVTVQDNVGADNQALAGAIGWGGTIGTWTLNADVGTTKPIQGSATSPDLDLSFLAKGSAAGTITIAFFDDGFGPVNGTAKMSIGGTGSGATVTYTTYTRGGTSIPAPGATYNPLLDGWTLLAGSGPLGGISFSDDFSGGMASGGQNPFELLQVITITVTTGTAPVTTGDATLTAPDGGMTLMLLGSSLAGLGLLRRSFKRSKV